MAQGSASEDATRMLGPPPPAAGEQATARDTSGTGALIDRYVVLEEIGRGGMGVVLRAYDPKLQREVALKVVRTVSADAEARLVREAQAMAQLSHPNVVAVYDVAVGEGAPQSQVVLAMEYVAGTTLGEWLASADRSAGEVIGAFVAAGQGVAAAHREGLLHRDFKPANVLVGVDGRVRVTDFGLARFEAASSAPDSLPAGQSGSGSGPSTGEMLTQVGTVMGTPRYMAPEQHRADSLTPAVDQYAYCVSLWQALHGAPPFEGAGKDLLHAKLAGPPAWPRGVKVPSRAAEAIRRGLRPDAHDRFTTMDELLAELQPRPSTTLRLYAPAAALVGAVGIAAWTSARPTEADTRCTGAASALEGVWNTERRAQVERAIVESGTNYAPGVWIRLGPQLDAWAGRWTDMHTSACEATRLRGEQSEAVMDLRIACLDRARQRLDAAAGVLEGATAHVVDRAHRVVERLPDLERCADVEALQADVPPPAEAEAEAVRAIRADLAIASAKHSAGQAAEALAAARRAEVATDAVEYEPIRTEVWAVLADVHSMVGAHDEAEASIRRAIEHGARWRQWDDVRAATVKLIWIVGSGRAKPDEALALVDHARGMSAGDPMHEAYFRGTLASVLRIAGRFEDALTEEEAALALLTSKLGADDPKLATSRSNLATIYYEQGEYARAEAEHRAILSIKIDALGAEHPDVGHTYLNLANTLFSQGKLVDAEVELRKALANKLAAFGPDHPDVATVRNNLAGALHEQGRIEEAEAEVRAVVQARIAMLGPSHVDVGGARNNLGHVLKERGDYEGAEAEYRAAVEIYEAAMGPEHHLVATGRDSLGNALRLQGRSEEAEVEHRAALGIRRRVLAPDHPDIALSLTAIAALLHDRGAFAEAESEYRAVIEHRMAALGPEHPQVGAALSNLGNVLLDQGRLDEAETEQRRSLAIRIAASGPEHTDVATSRHNLAGVLRARGDLEAAETEERTALRLWTAALGPDNPLIAESRGGLADGLFLQARYAEAETEYRAARSVAEGLGPAHPKVAERLVALGDALVKRGRKAEALPLLERAWMIAEQAEVAPLARAAAAFALARALPDRGAERARAETLALEALEIYASAGAARSDEHAEVAVWLNRP